MPSVIIDGALGVDGEVPDAFVVADMGFETAVDKEEVDRGAVVLAMALRDQHARGRRGFQPTSEGEVSACRKVQRGVGAVIEERSEEHTSELQSRGHLVAPLFPYTTLFRSEVPDAFVVADMGFETAVDKEEVDRGAVVLAMALRDQHARGRRGFQPTSEGEVSACRKVQRGVGAVIEE